MVDYLEYCEDRVSLHGEFLGQLVLCEQEFNATLVFLEHDSLLLEGKGIISECGGGGLLAAWYSLIQLL